MPTPPPAGVATPPPASLKRHLIAAALSAFVPGAGQLYLGKRQKAMVIFVILIAASIGFWPLRLPRSFPGLAFLIWVLLPLSLYAVYEALLGRNVTSSSRLSKWRILPLIPIHYLGLNLLFTSLLFGSGFHTARNLGSAMEPTLANRQRFVYDTACYRSQPKCSGDIVVFHYRDSLFIKRIAGVGGDTIEGNEKQILVNGQPIRSNADARPFAPVTVAKGKYFVLGDNLDVSLDSRTPSFGLVDEDAIIGKVLYSYQFTDTQVYRRLDGSRWAGINP
jgi:signal peptidase I